MVVIAIAAIAVIAVTTIIILFINPYPSLGVKHYCTDPPETRDVLRAFSRKTRVERRKSRAQRIGRGFSQVTVHALRGGVDSNRFRHGNEYLYIQLYIFVTYMYYKVVR